MYILLETFGKKSNRKSYELKLLKVILAMKESNVILFYGIFIVGRNNQAFLGTPVGNELNGKNMVKPV